MIPLRNFPYSDYHDLNLDWLLRRIYQFEVDLEDLKRRVKRLEDWREIAEPAITDLVSRMLIVEGNIVTINREITNINNTIDDHSRRITVNEGNITTLKDNIKSYYIIGSNVISDSFNISSIVIKEGSVTGATVDISSSQDFIDFVTSLRSLQAVYGDRAFKFYIFDTANDNIYEAVTSISEHSLIVSFATRMTKTRKISQNTFIINGFGTSYTGAVNNGEGFCVQGPKTITLNPSSFVSSSIVEYPYKIEVSMPYDDYVSFSSEARLYFDDINDFLTYSDILSDFVETHINSITIYSKEIPSEAITLQVYLN